ncbi:YggS family pyridoxal phosphate-dependent enzyme [Candidatus Pelagibacter sp.]|nr:YggS family pyridoxal phosphate-dependent enzyme [Candidatus Pelagibacter sp.]
MHHTVQNLIDIKKSIINILEDKNISKIPKIIAVSKTFSSDKILPLIDYGHIDYGENKVQEAIDKWTDIKSKKSNIKLHMIGKLQTNKVKFAVKLFDYIHSVDSEKLAQKIFDEQTKINRKIKIFIQVNIGEEDQKSGINKNELSKLIIFCKKINLEVVGLMCIPPANSDPEKYFIEMNLLNNEFKFKELSMGMSSDFIKASENNASFLRIGSSIFGQRY